MIRSICVALALLLVAGSSSLAQQTDLNVMAFNIRYAHTTPPNLWSDRRAAVRQVIVDSTGDVPLRFQPYLVDPTGRFFEIEIRKLF